MRAALGLFLVFLGIYTTTFHGFIDVEDVEVCYQSTRSLVEEGTLAIGETDAGRTIIEERFMVVPGDDGRFYPVYPIARILLGVPGYVLGRSLEGLANDRPEELTRFVYASTNVLCSALLCVVVFLLTRTLGFGERCGIVCALFAGLGTMLWAYSQSTFMECPFALLYATGIWCLVRALHSKHAPSRGLVLAGVFLALAAQVRPVGFLLLLPVFAYARVAGLRGFLAIGVPVVMMTAALFCLDFAVFERPFAASYFGRAEQNVIWTRSYGLSVFGLLASEGRGLFTLSPILILALFGLPTFFRRAPREARLVVSSCALLVLFFALIEGWDGGWCWGPRFLLPAVPLLAAASGAWLLGVTRLRRLVITCLAIASLWIQVLSVSVSPRIYMTAISSTDADLVQFYFLARSNPIAMNQRVLLHKLAGERDLYTLRWLFDLPNDRELDMAQLGTPEINRYCVGFQQFAWVRVWGKGHRSVAVVILALCASLSMSGVWLLRRSWLARRDEDVVAQTVVGDEAAPSVEG